MKTSQKLEWAIFIIIMTFLLAGCVSLAVITMLEKY